MAKLATFGRSVLRFPNESMRLVMVTIIGAVLGFFIGISFPSVSITKLHFPASFVSYIEDKNSGLTTQAILNHAWTSARNARGNGTGPSSNSTLKVCYITLCYTTCDRPFEWYPLNTTLSLNT
jgi:hypothetical protein